MISIAPAKLKDSTRPRVDNRRGQVVDAAASLFRERGFHAASMRDIAARTGMLPGSIYYHFPSKEELLVAVYEEGVRRISESVQSRIVRKRTPGKRLAAACEAHLEALLDGSDFVQVVIRVLPKDAPKVEDKLVALRSKYEKLLRDLVGDLPDLSGKQKHYLRLMLIGAMNWTQVWYQPGRTTPREIARSMLDCVKLEKPS